MVRSYSRGAALRKPWFSGDRQRAATRGNARYIYIFYAFVLLFFFYFLFFSSVFFSYVLLSLCSYCLVLQFFCFF